jgi:tetratricopeptide (TPR) repeat protein
VTPSAHRDRLGRRSPAVSAPRRSRALWLLAALPLFALAAGFLLLRGSGSGLPPIAPLSSAAAGTALEARLAPWQARLDANPADAEALTNLGDINFDAGRYAQAITWYGKLVVLDPGNETALLMLGTSTYNSGDVSAAERIWKQVLALDPDSLEAHYNLGSLYLNLNPVDIAGVKREWGAVVRLDPGSEISKTLAVHLQAFDPSPVPSAPAAAPSAAASPDGSATP